MAFEASACAPPKAKSLRNFEMMTKADNHGDQEMMIIETKATGATLAA